MTIVSLLGQTKYEEPRVVFRYRAAFLDITGSQNGNHWLGQASGQPTPLPSNEVTDEARLDGEPRTNFSLSFTLADEAREFHFIANPEITSR